MQYEVISWSLVGAATFEEGKFIQNTNIKVGIIGAPAVSINDGCSVDITGKVIGPEIMDYLEQECEDYVNQKYNQQP